MQISASWIFLFFTFSISPSHLPLGRAVSLVQVNGLWIEMTQVPLWDETVKSHVQFYSNSQYAMIIEKVIFNRLWDIFAYWRFIWANSLGQNVKKWRMKDWAAGAFPTKATAHPRDLWSSEGFQVCPNLSLFSLFINQLLNIGCLWGKAATFGVSPGPYGVWI